MTKYTRGWDFIRKSMGKFSPKKVREWFELHGVPLKIEADMRVFPVSDNGKDIVGVFETLFEKNRDRVTLHYGEWVSNVSLLSSRGTRDLSGNETDSSPEYSGWNDKTEANQFYITTPKWNYESEYLVITTGGNAYSHTGSTGDGYAFARELGHSVTQLWPSLSSFLTRESWTHKLSGLAFENARISLVLSSRGTRDLSGNETDSSQARNDKVDSMHSLTWPLLLTHFGISWPLAFMTSSSLAWEQIDKEHTKKITLSPLLEMWSIEWEIFLKTMFQTHPKKILTSILSEKLPRRFAEAFVLEYFPDLEATFACSISKVDRERVVELLGNGIPITFLERKPWDEFVTAGWVETSEIESETMESKIHKNLYFAGEVLNVDGYTGGYSLQICWASGYTAGKSILTSIL